jgi:hypothetical protein
VTASHLSRLDACTVAGMWAERGGYVGVQGAMEQLFHGNDANRAGHADCADQPVRAPPSPTAPARVRRYRAVS